METATGTECTRWAAYAHEYADYVLPRLTESGVISITDKAQARVQLATSIARELESLDTVMQNSVAPNRDYIAFATAFAIRRLFKTDQFINRFVDYCSTNEQVDVTDTIRARVELKIATEEAISAGVNQIVNRAADWCKEAADSVRWYFEEAKKSDTDITADEIEHWQKQYKKNYDKQQRLLSGESTPDQQPRKKNHSGESKATPDVPTSAGSGFGELVATIIGYAIVIAIILGLIGQIANPIAWKIAAVIAYFAHQSN